MVNEYYFDKLCLIFSIQFIYICNEFIAAITYTLFLLCNRILTHLKCMLLNVFVNKANCFVTAI